MATRPGLLLDITRSLRRLRHRYPSGIDRVERAYITWAIGQEAQFLARQPGGWYQLDADGARALVALLDGGSWPLDLSARLRPDRDHGIRMGEAMVRHHARRKGRLATLAGAGEVYLNTGHVNLSDDVMAGLGACRRVVMLHDLIPLEHPEFARPNGPRLMRARLRAACRADHLVAISEDTARRITRVAAAEGLSPPPITVIPIGIDPPGSVAPPGDAEPYFVCLGTIEPRKNHALLLDLWQPDWPPLHVIGRRGWENREVFARLDRAPDNVIEENDLDDATVWQRIAGATALLFPSHVEGFGLPLAEALARGTPAIVSDIAAFREVGGDVPEYLPPDDPVAWRSMIRAYIAGPTARAAQTARMSFWQQPGWPRHFCALESLLEGFPLNKTG
ncbi:MAG: glycosyltransferase family 1 protein [Pseudomonadota bacterium]